MTQPAASEFALDQTPLYDGGCDPQTHCNSYLGLYETTFTCARVILCADGFHHVPGRSFKHPRCSSQVCDRYGGDRHRQRQEVVEGSGRVSDLPALVQGLEWRRGWRSAGPHLQIGLREKPRRRCHLAEPDLWLSERRQRLRSATTAAS